MSDGGGLSDRDIDAISRRLQQILQPAVHTGADADVVRRVMREEIQRSDHHLDADQTRKIVREEIDRNLDNIRRMIREEAERFAEDKLQKIFRDLDMSIDPDKIVETRKKLGRLFEWQASAHEWRGTFLSTIVKSAALWFAGLMTAGLAYMGLKGGGPH